METDLITSISTVGFSVVACIVLWKAMLKKDENNKIYTDTLVNNLENSIKELKIESKKDKQIFEKALKTFDVTVKSFTNIKEDISDIKTDLNDIKKKIEK